MGAHRRGRFQRPAYASYVRKLNRADLSGGGGGSKATARKRQEKIAWLGTCVDSLSQQIKELQSQFAKPKAKQLKKAPKPKKTVKAKAQSTLYGQLLSTLQEMKENPPSDAQVMAHLQSFLNKTESKPVVQDDSKKQTQSKKTIAPQAPESWASLFHSKS